MSACPVQGLRLLPIRVYFDSESGNSLLMTNDQQQMTINSLTRIRAFRSGDINQIIEIEGQAFPKTAYSREIFMDYARRFPGSFIVIERGKDIAGYMIFDRSGHIHSTAVKTAYRRQGLGKMLFSHALSKVKKRLWLEVRSKNRGAIEFYRSLGMEIAGLSKNYYGNDDALIMVLNERLKG
jgi:ribosomal-protein-alanine N-acetyltransferase